MSATSAVNHQPSSTFSEIRDPGKRHRFWHMVVLGTLIVLFVVGVRIVAVNVLRATDGKQIYIHDDSYIAQAIAKNIAQHGVYGITRYGFSSTSSSIIWPWLLASVDLVAGVRDFNSFFLNLALGIVLIVFCYWLLIRIVPDASPIYAAVSVAAIALITPLPVLVFDGLEHLLHTLATVAFAYYAAQSLAGDGDSAANRHWPLYAFATLVTLARFEGMFLIFVAILLFSIRRRWLQAGKVAFAGFLPVLVYGAVSKAEGWFFFPNSVTLKGGNVAQLLNNAGLFYYTNKILQMSDVQVVFAGACVLLLVGLAKGKDFWEFKQLMLLMFLLTTLVHMQFGKSGWFYRYEAYLIAFGLLAIAMALHQYLRGMAKTLQRSGFAVLVALMLFLSEGTLLTQRIMSFQEIPKSASDIYEQQIQMARFVKKYYSGSTVALNDIGAVNYYADIHCLDVAGLGSYSSAVLRKTQRLFPANVDRFVAGNGGKIAILYAPWFAPFGGLPRHWIEVGEWTAPDETTLGDPTVTFYAVDPAEKEGLIKNLKEFSGELPKGVEQSGLYTQQ